MSKDKLELISDLIHEVGCLESDIATMKEKGCNDIGAVCYREPDNRAPVEFSRKIELLYRGINVDNFVKAYIADAEIALDAKRNELFQLMSEVADNKGKGD